jgi:hypothetical protein
MAAAIRTIPTSRPFRADPPRHFLSLPFIDSRYPATLSRAMQPGRDCLRGDLTSRVNAALQLSC